MTNNNHNQETITQIEGIRNLTNDSEKIDVLISVVRDLYSNMMTMNDLLTKTIEQASVISSSMNTALKIIQEGFKKADKRLNDIEKRY